MEREIENYLIEAIESYIFGYRIFRMIRNVRLVVDPFITFVEGRRRKILHYAGKCKERNCVRGFFASTRGMMRTEAIE